MNNDKIVIIYNAAHHVLLFKYELILSLKEKGYKVIVLSSVDKYENKLKDIVDDFYPIKLDSSGLNPIKDLYLIFQIYKLCSMIKPLAILNFTIKPVIYGTIASIFIKVPVINTITGLGTAFMSGGIVNWIARLLYKLTFNYSHLIYFQNPDDQNFFKRLKIIRKENTKIIPGSGVDLKKFKPIFKKKTEVLKILFIGRIIADKGIYELIEAIKIINKEYSNLSFILMGMLGVNNKTSISENQIKRWVSEGLVSYIGFKEDIRKELGSSDVVVLPSYREGTPKTLIEAASMAKPIIATDVPGCREVVINNCNGFLCKVKDSLSLANSIKKFIDLNYFSKLEMGKKSRILAEEKFDINKVNNYYLNELKKLI